MSWIAGDMVRSERCMQSLKVAAKTLIANGVELSKVAEMLGIDMATIEKAVKAP